MHYHGVTQMLPKKGSQPTMLRAVLFDLDGTLLNIELDGFFARYFGAIRAFTAPHFPGVDVLDGIIAGTTVMQRSHPGITNRDAFRNEFLSRTGIDLDSDWEIFEDFYRDVFPTLRTGYGPIAGGREAVDAAKRLGLKVAVATQPLFPASAITHRLEWAGLADVEFDAVTSYEDMRACKPAPEFFTQVAEQLGVAPSECLMVGDDRGNDMPASAVGMRTFFVGTEPDAPCDYRGTIAQLPELLQRLAGR
jgi:FMN phosphatase YigB (HAD superfamily)